MAEHQEPEDSGRAVFFAAALGAVAPLLCRWFIQEAVTVPSETWGRFFGWLFAVILFAPFTGYVGACIWKERTARRAFLFGIAFPYLVGGILADAEAVFRTRRAQAQEPARISGGLASENGSVLVEVSVRGKVDKIRSLKVSIVRSRLSEAMDKGDTRVAMGSFSHLASNAGPFQLPEGDYIISVSAPGYSTVHRPVRVEAEREITVSVELTVARFWDDVVEGFLQTIRPPRPSQAAGAPG